MTLRALILLLGVLLCAQGADAGSTGSSWSGGFGLFGPPVTGSSIAGVEEACAASGLYGSGGHCVCSETLDTSLFPFPTVPTNDSLIDWPDSPNTHECWGDQRPGSAHFTTSPSSVGTGTVDVSSRPGWGNANHAYEVRDGSGIWAQLPINMLTSATRTVCLRYYMDVDPVYTGAGDGGACSGGRRNKISMFNYPIGYQQGQERADSACKPLGQYYPFTMSIGGGTADGNYSPTPNVNWDSCNSAPCRIEVCLDGAILAGTGLHVRERITVLESGTPVSSTSTTPTFNGGGGPVATDFWGGDWWHGGTAPTLSGAAESSRRGYFTVHAWDVDNDDWPGKACEIEGC